MLILLFLYQRALIPIAIGVYTAFHKEDDEASEKFEHSNLNRLFWTMALITIASGGDNLGVYIPYFTTQDVTGVIILR